MVAGSRGPDPSWSIGAGSSVIQWLLDDRNRSSRVMNASAAPRCWGPWIVSFISFFFIWRGMGEQEQDQGPPLPFPVRSTVHRWISAACSGPGRPSADLGWHAAVSAYADATVVLLTRADGRGTLSRWTRVQPAPADAPDTLAAELRELLLGPTREPWDDLVDSLLARRLRAAGVVPVAKPVLLARHAPELPNRSALDALLPLIQSAAEL